MTTPLDPCTALLEELRAKYIVPAAEALVEGEPLRSVLRRIIEAQALTLDALNELDARHHHEDRP